MKMLFKARTISMAFVIPSATAERYTLARGRKAADHTGRGTGVLFESRSLPLMHSFQALARRLELPGLRQQHDQLPCERTLGVRQSSSSKVLFRKDRNYSGELPSTS